VKAIVYTIMRGGREVAMSSPQAPDAANPSPPARSKKNVFERFQSRIGIIIGGIVVALAIALVVIFFQNYEIVPESHPPSDGGRGQLQTEAMFLGQDQVKTSDTGEIQQQCAE
jgi:hypothetical protein